MGWEWLLMDALDAMWSAHEPQLVSGALMDAGTLPGDLSPSDAIRQLTCERDDAVRLLRGLVGIEDRQPLDAAEADSLEWEHRGVLDAARSFLAMHDDRSAA